MAVEESNVSEEVGAVEESLVGSKRSIEEYAGTSSDSDSDSDSDDEKENVPPKMARVM